MKIRLDYNEVDRAIREYVAARVTTAPIDRIEVTRGKGKTVYADIVFAEPHVDPPTAAPILTPPLRGGDK